MASELHPLRRASSFEICTANMAQSRNFIFADSKWKFLPHRHPKLWHSDVAISDWGLFFSMLLFLSEKIKTCWICKNTVFAQTGKNIKWAETSVWCLLWIFKVVYQDHLTVTSLCMGFCSKRAAAGLGPSGLNTFCHTDLDFFAYTHGFMATASKGFYFA